MCSPTAGFERADRLYCEFRRYALQLPPFFFLFLSLFFRIWRLFPVIAFIRGQFSPLVDTMIWIPRRSALPFWFLRPVPIFMRTPARTRFGTRFITRSLPNWFHRHTMSEGEEARCFFLRPRRLLPLSGKQPAVCIIQKSFAFALS